MTGVFAGAGVDAGRSGATGDAGDRLLRRVALLFTLAVIVHNADHLRRGTQHLHTDVFSLGSAGILLEVALVVLICARHRLAPLAAAAGGVILAVGYVEVHFLPAHGWLSDSFTSASHVSPLSWFAASFEVVAAVALMAAGFVVLRRRGGLASAARPRRAQRTLPGLASDPLAVLMVMSQVATLVVSFAQVAG